MIFEYKEEMYSSMSSDYNHHFFKKLLDKQKVLYKLKQYEGQLMIAIDESKTYFHSILIHTNKDVCSISVQVL